MKIKHYITVEFETEEPTALQNHLINHVTQDMLAQLESLADATDERGHFAGIDYEKATVTHTTEFTLDIETGGLADFAGPLDIYKDEKPPCKCTMQTILSVGCQCGGK